MTAMDLLEAIGFIQDRFIQETRQAAPRRTIPLRRGLLIAAVIAALAVLLGCAVLLHSLRDVELGTTTYDAGFGQTQQAQTLSLQGYLESPGFLAAREWLEFSESYDPEGTARADAQDYAPPEEYDAYFCFTPQMTAQVDAIAARYGLSLLGKLYTATTPQTILTQLGLPSLGEGLTLESAYCYQSGTCQLTFSLDGDEGAVFGSLRYVRKGDFDTVALTVEDPDAFRQWEVSVSGQQVLLAQGQRQCLILLDGDAFFTTVVVYSTLEQAALEKLAQTLPLTAHPQPPEFPQVLKTDYCAYVRTLAQSVSHPENMLYAQQDLDGDGIEEFWYGFAGADILELVTMNGGQLHFLLTGGAISFCQDGIIEQLSFPGSFEIHSYYEIRDSTLKLLYSVVYAPGAPDGELWWLVKGEDSSQWPLTEEAYNEYLSRHPYREIEMKPISEYPGFS